MQVLTTISIREQSRVPKYRQIVDSIIENISTGNLMIDEKIPSINLLSEEFDLSRDTVEKAYNILKDRKIITAVKGKGFYVAKTSLISKVNILFLINKLSTYKMRIYNAFIESMEGNCHTDLHIYHCDESLFLNLLRKNLHAYDHYVIMPHFKGKDLRHQSGSPEIVEIMEQIPKHKLVLLDNNFLQLKGEYAEVYQDFKEDIYQALCSGMKKIHRYKKLIIAYPRQSVYPYPKRILHGFRKFCVEAKMDFEIIDEIYEDTVLHPGDLFITITESDLVNLVKQIRDRGMKLGRDIGVISYNDTPLKDLLGISVISTDFVQMGQTAARMILNSQRDHHKNPFCLIDRNSL